MTKFIWPLLCCALCVPALAKLPPPDDAAKAKAAELAVKADWQKKMDGYLLCQAQDKMVARWRANAAPAAAAAAVAVPQPPCANPGPFASNAPAQKPLETAEAHSPTGTAASPPSMKQPSAVLAPAK
jgi:hypothetical protein